MIRAHRFLAMLIPALTLASVPPDRHDELDEVMVSGMRASQGGAQDIRFFRGQVEMQRIPHPNDFTAEGLMSEHDLVLPAAQPCRQLFCLTGDASRADLIAAPEARYLVGVGFASNIDAKTWRRDPVNLIAVVDKSGSMSGKPLELVRRSLAEVAGQLRAGDQMSIVLYGDTAQVHLAPTPVRGPNDRTVLAAIEGIESMGSTSMEAGLRVGYRVADETAPAFKGRTRLMLFTDERPNTDATDAASFMGMAIAHSQQDVGLTTVGVGVQFGAELATKVGSVRGGNLFFIRDAPDVDALFKDQLDYMVSELAHDLTVSITPRAGLKIAGVYGVPGELLGWQDSTRVKLTIPTVFLDNHGGGIFFTLAPETSAAFLPEKDAAPLADVAVEYTPLGQTAREGHGLSIGLTADGPSAGMRLGHLLIDEFTVLHDATSAHYLKNDQETAYQLLSRFRDRLASSGVSGMDDERKLIDTLYSQIAFLSGHGSGEAQAIAPSFVKLWGRWKIVGVHGAQVDLHSGETLEFTPDNDMLTWAKRAAGEPRDSEAYESNAQQIYLPESELVFHYHIKGDKLSLHHRRSGLWVQLVRSDAG